MDYAVIVNEVIDYSEIITGSIPLQINKLNNIGNKINASQTQTNARTRSIISMLPKIPSLKKPSSGLKS